MVRRISRGTKLIKNHISNVHLSIFSFIKTNPSDFDVQRNLCAIIGNIAIDSATVKTSILDDSKLNFEKDIFFVHSSLFDFFKLDFLLKLLINNAKNSNDLELRRICLCCLKNLNYALDSTSTKQLMSQITYPTLTRFVKFIFHFISLLFQIFLSLATDSEPQIREQAIGILRNLAHSHEKLLESLSLSSFEQITKTCFIIEKSEEILKHYLNALCNIILRSPETRHSLVSDAILSRISNLLSESSNSSTKSSTEMKVPCVWLLELLTMKEEQFNLLTLSRYSMVRAVPIASAPPPEQLLESKNRLTQTVKKLGDFGILKTLESIKQLEISDPSTDQTLIGRVDAIFLNCGLELKYQNPIQTNRATSTNQITTATPTTISTSTTTNNSNAITNNSTTANNRLENFEMSENIELDLIDEDDDDEDEDEEIDEPNERNENQEEEKRNSDEEDPELMVD